MAWCSVKAQDNFTFTILPVTDAGAYEIQAVRKIDVGNIKLN